jgi:hypothetical protein
MNNLSPSAATASGDVEALRRIVAVEPVWNGIVRIGEVAPSANRVLFHAGPKFDTIASVPAPVRNSLAFGCIYEGWAENWQAADALLDSGAIALRPAQDVGLLVPLAGVASPSMAAVRIADAGTDDARYCVLNEGAEIATRLGLRDDRLLDHHHWLNEEFADWLAGCLADPIAIFPLMLESFTQGDDGHAQTGAGSRLIAQALRQRAFDVPDRVSAFLDQSAAFALNIWMATIGLVSGAAAGVAGSSVVVRAGGNGVSFGYSIASDPHRWIVTKAPALSGNVDPKFGNSRPTDALGDSAVLDFFGLGGLNLHSAPALAAALATHLPADYLERAEGLLAGVHPRFGGRAVASVATRAVAKGKGPIILLGMIDAAGKSGRLGGGVVDTAGHMFVSA